MASLLGAVFTREKPSQSCGRYFMVRVEVLLFSSPFQQCPQVLPAPATRASITPGGHQAWHRGRTATAGPRCPLPGSPQRLPWHWAELKHRLALGLWLSGLKVQVCLSSLAQGDTVAAAWLHRCSSCGPGDPGPQALAGSACPQPSLPEALAPAACDALALLSPKTHR